MLDIVGAMDATLFDRLLYEEESPTLDFKQGQYRFVAATDLEKSELLKDILGFANAWRRSEAYILIGVKKYVADGSTRLPQWHIGRSIASGAGGAGRVSRRSAGPKPVCDR